MVALFLFPKSWKYVKHSRFLCGQFMSKRFARFTIFIVVLLTIGAGFEITKLTFDYEFEHFFPSDDPELEFYQDFKEKFDTDIDFVLLGLKNEAGIFEEDFLTKASEMKSEMSQIPHVKRIISPFDASDYAIGPFGPIAIPYLHINDPERYGADSARIYKYQKQVGGLFSADAKSISMFLVLDDTLSKVETDTVYQDLVAVFNKYQFDEFHAAGKAIGQAYYITQIQYEFTLFILIAIGLITLVLFLIYRSVWGVFVPLLVVLLSVVWLLGLMSLLGKSIDIMTTLLPLVIFVVGISDVIHLLSRYFEGIRAGNEKIRRHKDRIQASRGCYIFNISNNSIGFLDTLNVWRKTGTRIRSICRHWCFYCIFSRLLSVASHLIVKQGSQTCL